MDEQTIQEELETPKPVESGIPPKSQQPSSFKANLDKQLKKILSEFTGLTRDDEIQNHLSALSDKFVRLDELENAGLEDKERLIKNLQAENKKISTQNKELTENYSKLFHTFSSDAKRNAVMDWASKNGSSRPDRVAQLILNELEVEIGDDFKPIIRDKSGTDLKNYLEAYKADKNNADLFATLPNPTPGNGSGNQIAGSKKNWTPSEIKALSKADFIKHEADIDAAMQEGRVSSE